MDLKTKRALARARYKTVQEEIDASYKKRGRKKKKVTAKGKRRTKGKHKRA